MAGGRLAAFIVARPKGSTQLVVLSKNGYRGREREVAVLSSHRTKEAAHEARRKMEAERKNNLTND